MGDLDFINIQISDIFPPLLLYEVRIIVPLFSKHIYWKFKGLKREFFPLPRNSTEVEIGLNVEPQSRGMLVKGNSREEQISKYIYYLETPLGKTHLLKF